MKPLSESHRLPLIVHGERETQREESYYWDNSRRTPAGTIVIQRTLRGAAWLHDAAGGTRHEVPAGRAMLFVHGERTVYGIGAPHQRPYELEYVCLLPAAGIGELLAQIRADFGSVIAMEEGLEAARILREIVAAFGGGRSRDRLELAELAYRLMLAIYREQLAGSRGNDPVGYGRHLIENRFRSPTSLKEVIAAVGMSREHFTRVFTERYGESPGGYLRRLRLEHARLLARTSTMPVEDLAPACGFASAQTFRRAYQRQFGRTIGTDRPHRPK